MSGWIRRPVKTLVWAFSVGVGVASLTLLSVDIAREIPLPDRGALLLASSIVPDTSGALLWSLRITPSDASDHEPIRRLRLRMSQVAARQADVHIVSPPPSSVQTMGSGRYFEWKSFAPRQTIVLRLRPRHGLRLELLGQGFARSQITLSPR